jgi:hypothetical protein
MEDFIPEGAIDQVDEYDRAIEDNFSNAYLKRREVFGVINGPAFRALEKVSVEPQDGQQDTTEPKEGQEAVSHEPVIHPADAYLLEKFPDPVSTITTQPEPTMEDEMEGRKGLWENVGKPVLKALGMNLDADQDAFDRWVGDFEEEFGRPPEFDEVPQEIWDKIEWTNAEIPLDAPKKLAQGAAAQALKRAASKADDVLGFSKKPILEIMEGGADDAVVKFKRKYRPVWHGGPSKWSPEEGFLAGRPRVDMIGQGEGAAAYGHGFYAADVQDVAKTYVPRDFDLEDAFMGQYKLAEKAGDYDKMEVYEAAMMHETPAELSERFSGRGLDKHIDTIKKYYEKSTGGFLYKIDIPDEDIHKLLDWDKPLSEQSERVKNFITKEFPNGWTGNKNPSGQEIYNDLFGGGKTASDRLASGGIPGHKYYDGLSRQGGGGTNNYVIWDQNVLDKSKILERNGEQIKVGAEYVTGNINFSHINTTDDAKALIDDVAKRFEGSIDEARRGVVSHEETMRLADLTGMTPERLLARRQGEAFNAHEALAARQILVSSAENLSELAQKVALGSADDMDKFAFRKALSTHYALQSQVSGMTAEAGRALNAFRIDAAGQAGRQKAIKEMMKTMDGKSTDEMAQMLATMDTPEQVGRFVKDAQKATSFDMLLEAWINGLLSGPQTHAVNSTSNALVSLWMVPERLMASAIGKIPKVGSGEIKAQEALYQAYGLVEGFKDGLKSMGHTLKTGEAPDMISKLERGYSGAITAQNVKQTFLGSKFARHLDEGTPLARAVDLMGEGVRLPGRFLEAEDALFKSVGYRMELRARAFRQASLEGLEGEAASSRIHQILNDPEQFAPDIHTAAIDAMRYQTFTQPLGEGMQGMQKFLMTHKATKFVVPFVRTPTNILKFAFERTPLAPLSKMWRG